MADKFENLSVGLSGPIEDLFSITPSDTVDLDHVTRAVIVDETGFVTVETKSGTVARVLMIAGFPYPIRAKRIHASGTTAIGITGGF